MEPICNSKKVLLSLIGIQQYEETQYCLEENRAKPGRYVAVAIDELLSPKERLIVMTKEAERKHADELSKYINYTKISIPDGKNESELWQIFQQISDAVPANANLIIDVTHGFRSQPMILLAIAVYLQVTKSVTVSNILYGAFDNKDKPGITPLFDLHPFLALINWSFAAGHFMRTGDAGLLADLIIPIHNEQYRSKQEYRPTSLSSIGKSLEKITEAFSVVRPMEIASYTNQFLKKIPGCFADVENIEKVKPFKTLLEEMEQQFCRVAVDPDKLYSIEGVHAQVEMIKIYISNRQYQQAITLARELIVTTTCLKNGLNCTTQREDAEFILNTPHEEFVNESKKIMSIWRNLGNFRNDINHAGTGRQNPTPSDSLIKQIKINCEQVCSLIQEGPA